MVTIDAMGCQVAIADKIVAHEADYLLALKGNQPTLETDVKDYFRTAPDDEVVAKPPVVEKGHGGVESMHWHLDCEFGDDLSRYRTGHGAKNMAVVRRFALGLIRANKDRGSVKTRRKKASWDPDFLLKVLQLK